LFELAALDRPVPQNRVEDSLMNDSVSKLQPRPPVIVPENATVAEALRAMVAEDVGAVLVADAHGMLAGIFTERDAVTKVAALGVPLDRLPVSHVMTPKPETVPPDAPIALALHKMDVGGYRHLPVVQDGRPVGILSVRAILRHITRICE
jgi:CBS domain-containing protein